VFGCVYGASTLSLLGRAFFSVQHVFWEACMALVLVFGWEACIFSIQRLCWDASLTSVLIGVWVASIFSTVTFLGMFLYGLY
jgi:hypothetical protein